MSRKPYVTPMNKHSWWLSQGAYTNYFMREVSCVFIGIYSIIVIVGLMRLGQGPEAWEGFLKALTTQMGIGFHAVALFFSIYHAMSWFNVTPSAMRIQMGENFVPGPLIVGAHYGGWVVISVIFFLVVGV